MKSHNKADGGDSFADLLASVDDTAAQEQAAQTAPAAGAAQPAAQSPVAGDGDDLIEDDAGIVSGNLPLTASVLAAVQAKPLIADVPADKAAGTSEDTTPAANDNDGADLSATALAQPVMAAPQPQAPAQAQTEVSDQSVGPLAANAPAAAPQGDDADLDTNETAATPQAANAEKPAPAAAKAAKPAADFKKVLNDTRPADAAQAPGADAKDGGKTDIQQADARPASPQPSAHNDNQPSLQPVAANAPQQLAADKIQTASAPAALPATHHVPNMQSLAVDIAARSQSGTKQFDIRLDPPELGRVEVRLSIDSAGKAQAHLSADQPRTLDLLQKDAPALTRALREAGLDVSQDGLNFSLRQQGSQAGQDQQQLHSGRTLRASFTTPSHETATGAAAYSGRALGLLDIRV